MKRRSEFLVKKMFKIVQRQKNVAEGQNKTKEAVLASLKAEGGDSRLNRF